MVTPSKARVAGCVYAAPVGTALPTDATTALGSGFVSLGHVSEDGVKRNATPETTVVKAWGGSVVAVLASGKTETFQEKFIDIDNISVLGLAFGNASGSLDSGIVIKSEIDISTPHAFVIDSIMRDNVLHRIVIPSAAVSNVGEISYKDNEVVGFDLTLTAMQDSAGVTAYEYMKKAAAGD